MAPAESLLHQIRLAIEHVLFWHMDRTDRHLLIDAVFKFLAFAHTDMSKLASSCREGMEKLKSELHDSIQKGVKFVQNPPAPKK